MIPAPTATHRNPKTATPPSMSLSPTFISATTSRADMARLAGEVTQGLLGRRRPLHRGRMLPHIGDDLALGRAVVLVVGDDHLEVGRERVHGGLHGGGCLLVETVHETGQPAQQRDDLCGPHGTA